MACINPISLVADSQAYRSFFTHVERTYEIPKTLSTIIELSSIEDPHLLTANLIFAPVLRMNRQAQD